ALETIASICTTLPNLIGASKEILSTEAVTTGAPQCFIAESAAAISIQYINLPPIKFPKVLVSFGKTNSVMITWLSATFFGSIKYFYKDTRNKVQGRRKAKSESTCTLILVPCTFLVSPYICPFSKIQQIAMEAQPRISFDNTEYAFAYKSDKELKKAHFLFSVMGKPWLVKLGTKMAPVAVKWNLPFVKSTIRSTIFKQFVGGETLEQNVVVADKLEKFGVQVILDYGVEGKEGEENFYHACDEFIRVINYAATQPNIPFISVKVTGFARFGLLEKLDAMMHQNPGSLMKKYLKAVDDLPANEREEWHRVRTRMLRICE